MKVGSHRRTATGARKLDARRKKAEALLSNALFVEAWEKVDAKLFEGFKDEKGTPETRERAYLMSRLLQQLRKEFEIVIRDGRSAVKLLEQEQVRGRTGRSKPDPSV